MRRFIIYCHTNRVNGKKYVGQTEKTWSVRWAQCVNGAKKNLRGPRLLQAAIRKYGADAFDHEVLEKVEGVEAADESEVRWIATLNTMVPSGYNLTSGGHGPRVLSEETRRKLREQYTPEEWVAFSLRTAASMTPEQKHARALKVAASLTREQRREKSIKGAASQTQEQRSAKAAKRWTTATPEQRARHAALISAVPREVRVAAAYKQWETKRSKMSPERLAEIEIRKERERPRPGKASESKKAWWASRTSEDRRAIAAKRIATTRTRSADRRAKEKEARATALAAKAVSNPRTAGLVASWDTRRRKYGPNGRGEPK